MLEAKEDMSCNIDMDCTSVEGERKMMVHAVLCRSMTSYQLPGNGGGKEFCNASPALKFNVRSFAMQCGLQ